MAFIQPAAPTVCLVTGQPGLGFVQSHWQTNGILDHPGGGL